MIPTPISWQYVPAHGASYTMLSSWSEYTMKQADDECKLLDDMSSLWSFDDEEDVDFVKSIFAEFRNVYFWVAAYYSGKV